MYFCDDSTDSKLYTFMYTIQYNKIDRNIVELLLAN
jgi:hypothetical protein